MNKSKSPPAIDKDVLAIYYVHLNTLGMLYKMAYSRLLALIRITEVIMGKITALRW